MPIQLISNMLSSKVEDMTMLIVLPVTSNITTNESLRMSVNKRDPWKYAHPYAHDPQFFEKEFQEINQLLSMLPYKHTTMLIEMYKSCKVLISEASDIQHIPMQHITWIVHQTLTRICIRSSIVNMFGYKLYGTKYTKATGILSDLNEDDAKNLLMFSIICKLIAPINYYLLYKSGSIELYKEYVSKVPDHIMRMYYNSLRLKIYSLIYKNSKKDGIVDEEYNPSVDVVRQHRSDVCVSKLLSNDILNMTYTHDVLKILDDKVNVYLDELLNMTKEEM